MFTEVMSCTESKNFLPLYFVMSESSLAETHAPLFSAFLQTLTFLLHIYEKLLQSLPGYNIKKTRQAV